MSEGLVTSTGAPQGTVLSPPPLTLYTSDCQDNSETCHLQNLSDDTAVVGCIRGGEETEYRGRVDHFVEWCGLKHLMLNVTKSEGDVAGPQEELDTLKENHHSG